MKPQFKLTAFGLLLFSAITAGAQTAVPVALDSCRSLAIHNNKQIRIAEEKIRAAGYTRSVARAAYLPAIDFSGTYLYSSNHTSLLDSDRYLPIMAFNSATGKYEPKVVMQPDGTPLMNPETGLPVFAETALLPKSELEKDMHNVFALGFTLTQPLYMGGEIRALNKIAHYGEEMQKSLRDQAVQDVTYAVDEAYWLVVSLSEKQKLAKKFCELIEEMRRNVEAMLQAGVATQSDMLQTDVRYNEASLDLMRVENGLSLARMALAEVCGLPVDTQMTLADELAPQNPMETPMPEAVDMQQVFSRRNDLAALRAAHSALLGKEKVAMASMLPKVGLTASYLWTNPNINNGFANSFAGGFHAGVAVTVPLWHWGGNYNKYRAAKSEALAFELTIEDAEEKVTLQVRQARFKYSEAFNTYAKAESSIRAAEQNLANAEEGFKEGVMTMTDVNAAQTAWLKAFSEKIDAEIGIRLCRSYLTKVMGLPL